MSLARLFRRRRPIPFAHWGHDVRKFRLPVEGEVEFAQWRHPCTGASEISQDEIEGLRQFILPGDFAIDVGAHTGDTTVPMALAAGREGCVLALEPNPYVFKVLQANAALNPERTRIAPLCLAATEEDGRFVFQYGDASFCNGGLPRGIRRNPFRRKYPLSVEGRNLLRLLRSQFADWLPRLTYLKVDAEGHDRSILESILPVIRERRPVIRTEVYRKLSTGERHNLYDLLAAHEYRLFRFEGGATPQGKALDRRHITAERHFDILALPPRFGRIDRG